MDHVFHEAYPDPTHSMLALGDDLAPGVAFTFIQADALTVLRDRDFLAGFDVVHISPPCQGYSSITPAEAKPHHPQLIAPVRELLEAWGGVYVIENVYGARDHMRDPVQYCGSAFGLGVRRHRLWESNVQLVAPPCDHAAQPNPVGVYGRHPEQADYQRPASSSAWSPRRGDRARTTRHGQEAMGIPWMDWPDLVDAIPPAYTEHIGQQLLEAIA